MAVKKSIYLRILSGSVDGLRCLDTNFCRIRAIRAKVIGNLKFSIKCVGENRHLLNGNCMVSHNYFNATLKMK